MITPLRNVDRALDRAVPNAVSATIPLSIDEFRCILEDLATDPRANLDGSDHEYSAWVRRGIAGAGPKMRAIEYMLKQAPGIASPRLLDVGAEIGTLALLASTRGFEVAAVDLVHYASRFGPILADRGVDYRACDLGSEVLPFGSEHFEFVTYIDVIEHHAYSPRRVLQEIWRVLRPGGFLIVATPNHASLANRVLLLVGRSVHDKFEYFFENCSRYDVYPGHHREYTAGELRAALERTGFCVVQSRTIEARVGDVVRGWRVGGRRLSLSECGRLIATAVGRFTPGLGRTLWMIGQKIGESST